MAVRAKSNIIKLAEYDESINMLIYGNSGIGKTVFGGTAGNGLILGLESGVISAKRQGSKCDLWPVEKWEDVQDCYAWIRDNPGKYKWLVIDSISDMQEKLLRYILDKAMEDNKSRDPDIPAIQDHQKWQNMLKRFVNLFNDLPINVCYTALEMKRENEESEEIVLPLLLGKDYEISQMICGKMHVVGRMSDKVIGSGDERKKVRRIQFEHLSPYFAKDRYDCLPRYMPSATIPKIEQLINESGGIKPAASTTRPRTRTAGRRTPARSARTTGR